MIRALLCGAVMIGSLAGAVEARATTVATYSFTQDGFEYLFVPGPLGEGTLSGSFSGTPDSSGNFSVGNLTAFSLTFTSTGGAFFTSNVLANVTLFSFEPAHSSSFDFVDTESGGKICSGAAAAFGVCGGSGKLGAIGQPPFGFANWETANAAVVTLTSTTTTPIAPALPLFVTSLAALAAAGWYKRRVAPTEA